MLFNIPVLNHSQLQPISIVAKEEKHRETKPTAYIVKDGDTLTSIAETNKSSVSRIWAKNIGLQSPDVIEPGKPLEIPQDSEILADRPLPAAIPAVASTDNVTIIRESSSGNTYTYGYCTWYAKNRRPDLPNNLGNADTWVARAAAQGIPTGSTPKAGAVGQRGMHVVYVEAVNGDGTILISEMNFEGWNVKSSRTVDANYFEYIY